MICAPDSTHRPCDCGADSPNCEVCDEQWPCACEWCANLDAKPCVVIERLERRIAQLERMAPKPTPLPPIDYSGMLTARMLFDAAQREADRGKDGSDLTFTRLLWIAQILAAVETAEALRVRTSGGDA